MAVPIFRLAPCTAPTAGQQTSQSTDKPSSVTVRPLRTRRCDDHSSSPAITRRVWQPTRWLRTDRPQTPPYLVLLRAGFCLPSVLPQTRCALTAPFHPYLGYPRRYIFCATIRQVTLPGRYPAHCPSELGLSSPPATSRSPAVNRSSGRLADCDESIMANSTRR